MERALVYSMRNEIRSQNILCVLWECVLRGLRLSAGLCITTKGHACGMSIGLRVTKSLWPASQFTNTDTAHGEKLPSE